MSTTVVFSGGPSDPVAVERALQGHRTGRVIAADSGLAACLAAGLHPDVVVGDLDSVDQQQLARARAAGARVVVHPCDKDATDLELALSLAAEDLPRRMVVIGSGGGRLDHLLAWAGVVGSPDLAHIDVEAWMGGTRLLPVHHRRTFGGVVGDVVSLLALHGPATGVCTTGLRWALTGGTLDARHTLGVSNLLTASEVTIEVSSGVVTVVLPPPQGRPEHAHLPQEPSP